MDVRMSEEIGELAAALARFQAVMPTVPKSQHAKIQHKSGGGSHSYSYADLAAVWGTARRFLSEQGLSVAQPTRTTEEGGIMLQCLLLHSSGEWLLGEMRLPLSNDIKQVGGSFTYLRRYMACAMVGIVTEDEDTDAAGWDPQRNHWRGAPPQQQQRQAPRQRTDSRPPPRGEQSGRPEPPASQPQPPPPAREPSPPTDRAPEPPPVQQGPAEGPTAAEVIAAMQAAKASNGGEHPEWAIPIYEEMIPGGKVTARGIKAMAPEALAELLAAVRAGGAS